MPLPLQQFTAVAGKAIEFASLFNTTFASGFQDVYALDLTSPVGPSTAGGKQSLQHIRLVPRNGAPAIVIGSVNPIHMMVEIRTFRHLAELHARRFRGERVPVDPNGYRELTRRLYQFFAAQAFAVVMVDLTEAPASNPPPAPAAAGSSQTAWMVAGMAIAFAVGIAIIAALALRGRGASGAAGAPGASGAAVTAAPDAR